MSRTEYRIISKRVGGKSKTVIRQTERGALAHIEHMKWADAQPKKVYDDNVGCEVPTYLADLPPLEWTRLESRRVGPWVAVSDLGVG